MKVILATNNQGKLREFSELTSSESWLQLELAPQGFNPVETGKTFVENARIKAVTAAKLTGMLAIADDSGIVVEALNGAPGIHSARYCEGSDADRVNKLLNELKDVPDGERHASFICAMIAAEPDGSTAFSVIRFWEGKIARQPCGENGFGYDPIFLPKDKNCSAAQLTKDEKNQLSHRGKAFRQVLDFLKKRHETLNQAIT